MWSRDDKKFIVLSLGVVLIFLILSIAGEFLFHEEKHFSFEKIPFFEGLFGIFGALFLTLVVKITGKIVSRREEDYDRYYTS